MYLPSDAEEATQTFTIYEEMVEGFVVLGAAGTEVRANGDAPGSFEVRTAEGSTAF